MAALSAPALRRALSWHRRKLAVVCAVLAVLATIAAAAPDPAPTSAVVVATRALPGGTRLTAGDVELRRVDQVVAPEAVLTDPDSLLGRTLSAPATAGTMLTEADVLVPRGRDGGGVAAGGRVLAPVRVADAQVVALLRVGDPVDVLGTDPVGGAVQLVTEGARVAAVPSTEADGGLFTASGDGGSLVLLEVSPETAISLAEAAAAGGLSLLLR